MQETTDHLAPGQTIPAELSPSQAARMLGVSAVRVRQLCDSGELDHRSTPLGRLIDSRSVTRRLVERASRRGVPGVQYETR